MLVNDLKLTQNSYYTASANEVPSYPLLEDNITADVCVVGGGFAGLSSAIELADRGYKVVLLEANHIGFGASGRNGGQLIAGIEHALMAGNESKKQKGIGKQMIPRDMLEIIDLGIDLQYQLDGILPMASQF